MKMNRLCEECLEFTSKQCGGRPAHLSPPPNKLPCKNYELDSQLISDQDIESDERPPSLKDRKPSKPKDLVPDAVLPTNKVKADRFKRLATQRLIKTLDDIRKLGNLSAKANYESTTEQIESIAGRLHGAVDEFRKKYNKEIA